MPSKADEKYMRMTFELAQNGRGKTSPNPMVGALLVKNGQIIGRGYHRAVGQYHAEVAAIKDSHVSIRGATLYVNLEPCSHIGRTGPCTEAIIDAGIKQVVVATNDPNPLVDGKGLKVLKKAGLGVRNGVLAAEARLLNEVYFGYHQNKRPFVALKLAQTLDGRLATKDGSSKWLTSKDSRKFAHQIRADYDAVVVGAGTVRKDNPALTVRLAAGKNPYRIVLSNSTYLPRNSRLWSDNDDYKTIVVTSERQLADLSRKLGRKKLIYWSLKTSGKGRLDLHDFIDKAAAFGLTSILVEGGAALGTSFLKAGLVDKLYLFTAPLVMGEGINAVGDLNIRNLDKAIRFRNISDFSCGSDHVFVGYPVWRK